MDAQIGRVLAELDKEGRASNTLVVVVGDHGEGFMRHGYLGHTVSLYDELIQVPLIFSLPGTLKPAAITDPVHQIDIVPTLMALSQHQGEALPWDGVSLKPYLEDGRDRDSKRTLFSELNYREDLRKNAIIEGDYKLVHNLAKNKKALFNLKSDPEEKQQLRDKLPEIVKTLSEKLESWERRQAGHEDPGAAPPQVKIDAEQLEQLKTLGYM